MGTIVETRFLRGDPKKRRYRNENRKQTPASSEGDLLAIKQSRSRSTSIHEAKKVAIMQVGVVLKMWRSELEQTNPSSTSDPLEGMLTLI